ncbi:uncharacterized protein LOC108214679 [Daucus carota subsp. sativus]|uniref:uncharacterized protein LOC108214679 n=1 Tax=Daucus carota subsp. sativus TaxID=79200 RepID=UPI0007B23813|nr:PREDICTED: uncharacterized protein LOC108214679 [Daucus carota subsp. sativus]
MSSSGNEEMSKYYATIPIKKRKFPMVRYSPPPPDERSCLPVESVQNNLVGDNSSSCCQESSVLSADVGTSSNADKKSVLEIKREIAINMIVNSMGANADRFTGKAKAPTVHCDPLDTVDRQENVLLSRDQKMKEVLKVDLPPNEAPVPLVVKKEVVNKLDDSCTPGIFRMPETVQMFLGTNEPRPASMIGLNGDDFKQDLDKSYYTSFCLSINQDKLLDECKSDDVKSQVASPLVHADRLKWDLNTTMDDWEGPGGDGATPEPVFNSEATKKADINCPEPVISSSGILGNISDALEAKKKADINSLEPVISSSGVLGNIPCAPDAGKQFRGETDSICMPSSKPSRQYRYDNSLQPGSSTLMNPNFEGEPLASLVKVDSCRIPVNSNTTNVLVFAGNSTSVGNDTVKSEPYIEIVKPDCLGNKCDTMDLPGLVDKDMLERCSLKAVNFVTADRDDVIEPRSIKSEPVLGIQGADVIPCASVEKVVQFQVNVSSTSSSGLHTCPVQLKSGGATSQFEVSIHREEVQLGTHTTLGTSKIVDHVTADMDLLSHGDVHRQYYSGPEDAKSYEPLDPCGDAGNTISDKEINNVSAVMLEEFFCQSNRKAEITNDNVVHVYLRGSHDSSKGNNCEDCELTASDLQKENRKEENFVVNNYDGKLSSAFSEDDGNTARIPYWSDGYVEDQGETSDDHIKECVNSAQESGQMTSRGHYLQEIDQYMDRDSSFQESSTIESEATKMAINVTQNISYDLSRSDVQMGHDRNKLSVGGINEGQGIETNFSQMKDVRLTQTNKLQEVDPTLLKPESSITVNDAATASNSGGNQNRIINLPRGSNMTSPCMPRYVTDRSLLSTRERYADEDETVILQRNRVDNYADDPRRFRRDRFQTQPYRNPRIGQIRGRGRGRGFRQRDEWKFDYNSGADNYDCPPDYRVPRHKRASSGGNAQVEDNNYHISHSRVLGRGRGGIRPSRDVLPSFCHPSSRRFSTRDGDVTRTRGIQIVRRFPGNVFSNRCSDEDEFRHDEKFTRDFPEDHTGPIFNPSRPAYQKFDSRFARGNRNLPNIPRRAPPRIRSKSPVRFEAHQNGPWSSPERGSPDGRRFARRCVSPSYVVRSSHHFLDMESERMDRPRSANSDLRSPSNRIVARNTRTLNTIDPDDDEFGGPINSGRFQDLNADRKGDERRKGGDRCNNIRSFCQLFDADGGNLQFNSDDRPRPIRFSTEDGSELNERGSSRKRDFERRIKIRPGIAQSRMRDLDEEEANYRENKKVWHDDVFDDTSRMKRRL